jgi:hypothetical protein
MWKTVYKDVKYHSNSLITIITVAAAVDLNGITFE